MERIFNFTKRFALFGYASGYQLYEFKNFSDAEDFVKSSCNYIYTMVVEGEHPKIWGSSFLNQVEISTNWVHSFTRGDIPKNELKSGENYTKITMPDYNQDFIAQSRKEPMKEDNSSSNITAAIKSLHHDIANHVNYGLDMM